MRSTSLYPLVYLPVLIFLGLGSMWFHASITQFGGIIDELSMYIFVSFILIYTLVRMTDRDWGLLCILSGQRDPDHRYWNGWGT